MSTTELTGTWTKSHTGEWRARIVGDHPEDLKGKKVLMRRRNGDESTAEITGVAWEGKDKKTDEPVIVANVRPLNDGPKAKKRANSAYGRRSRRRFEEDEGSSFPCHVCNGYCMSGDMGYCPHQ